MPEIEVYIFSGPKLMIRPISWPPKIRSLYSA